MRPIDKGEAPNVRFHRYQDAEACLEERIGAYCSYCEFPSSMCRRWSIKKQRQGEETGWPGAISCYPANTVMQEKVTS